MVSVSVAALHAALACASNSSSINSVFFIWSMLPSRDGSRNQLQPAACGAPKKESWRASPGVLAHTRAAPPAAGGIDARRRGDLRPVPRRLHRPRAGLLLKLGDAA